MTDDWVLKSTEQVFIRVTLNNSVNYHVMEKCDVRTIKHWVRNDKFIILITKFGQFCTKLTNYDYSPTNVIINQYIRLFGCYVIALRSDLLAWFTIVNLQYAFQFCFSLKNALSCSQLHRRYLSTLFSLLIIKD